MDKSKKAIVKHPGGRPPSLERQLEEARSLAKQLRAGAVLGWQELAAEYPSLMAQAIQIAKGGYTKTVVDRDWATHEIVADPDVSMMKVLLELLPKVLGDTDEDDKSPIRSLLSNLKANLVQINIDTDRPVAQDGGKNDGGPTGVTVEAVVTPL